VGIGVAELRPPGDRSGQDAGVGRAHRASRRAWADRDRSKHGTLSCTCSRLGGVTSPYRCRGRPRA